MPTGQAPTYTQNGLELFELSTQAGCTSFFRRHACRHFFVSKGPGPGTLIGNMNAQVYAVLHAASVVFLTSIVFAIFAGAPESRRRLLSILVGVLSLVALVAGFGLATKVYQMPNPMDWPFWIWGKVVCWLGLSAIGGMAFKRRGKPAMWVWLTAILVLAAIYLAYMKPMAG